MEANSIASIFCYPMLIFILPLYFDCAGFNDCKNCPKDCDCITRNVADFRFRNVLSVVSLSRISFNKRTV